jgi:hypothetical protein
MPFYKGVLDGLVKEGHAEAAQNVADRLLRLWTRLKR